MAFQRDQFNDFYQMLRAELGGSDVKQRAVAENFLLEERLAATREGSYEEHLETPVDSGVWCSYHKNYLAKKEGFGETLGLPETFTDSNRPNLLGTMDEKDYLVRVERLDSSHLFKAVSMNASELFFLLQGFIADRNSSDADKVNSLLPKWNAKRDIRPCFAGFWKEVKDLFVDSKDDAGDNKDWANELRNRLGLGHLDPSDGKHDPTVGEPIPILLLRYRVDEVIAAIGADNAFAVPTVLDGDLNPFFCPSPNKERFGFAVDLGSDSVSACRLSREILHQKIDWKPEHLYRVGQITTSLGKNVDESNQNFAKARRFHLDCLQNDFKHFNELCLAA